MIRQMDYRQRMALLKRELFRIRAVCADTREMFQRMDNSADVTKKPGAELATVIVMLADPLSSYLSGATIAVTGGRPML